MPAQEREKQSPPAEDGVFTLTGERLDDDSERLRASRADVEPLFTGKTLQGSPRRPDGRDGQE